MNRYDFVIELITEAGERVLQSREKHIDVSTKNNDPKDVVTNVDIEISEFITEKIKEQFPEEVIYSEEAADVDLSKGSFWSIDPIDGTALFARGIPYFSVVVAYVESGVPIVGAIYNPSTHELFSFENGKGSFLNGKKVSVSAVTDLSQAYILLRAGRKPELWNWAMESYRFLLGRANKIFNFGSSGLDLCFVGAGRVEACIYGNLTPVDIIAAIGFVREAGGLVVGKDGKEITGLNKDKQLFVACNNSEILESLKDVLNAN